MIFIWSELIEICTKTCYNLFMFSFYYIKLCYINRKTYFYFLFYFYLGRSNIICTEDLIHEIFTVGPKFKYASNFLWPFKVYAFQNIKKYYLLNAYQYFALRHRHGYRITFSINLLLCRKVIRVFLANRCDISMSQSKISSNIFYNLYTFCI